MNWINNVVRPKISRLLTTRRDPPDDFWKRCDGCGQMLDRKSLQDNLFVFPCCSHHARMGAEARLTVTFDLGEFKRLPVAAPVAADPLRFRDSRRYSDRLKDAKAQTGLEEAVVLGEGKLGGQEVVIAAHDSRFMSGSLATAEGEAVITGMLAAVERRCPFILFAASGGARMQEGILSLMQMPRTTIAVQRLRAARLPYIVVLTDPTTGGVTASYAMLGDIHIAEPGALICFAGPRVIQQTIRENLPEGFQRAEYLLAHGMIDIVVHRHKLREVLANIVRILMSGVRPEEAKPLPVKVKGKPVGYIKSMNGHAVDGKIVESLARGSGIVEPEPVAEDERFEVRRGEQRPAGRTDTDSPRPRPAPKEAR